MESNDTDLDGSYNFYYGDIYIDVYDNFDTLGILLFYIWVQ